MSLMFAKVAKAGKGAESKSYEPLSSGRYDAVLSAIIDLELQPQAFDGEDLGDAPKWLLLFEIPSIPRTDYEGNDTTALVKLELRVSSHEKATLPKVLSALLKKSLTADQVYDIINSEKELKGLLGKAVVLDVLKKKSSTGRDYNKIKDVVELDSRLPQPKAVREAFTFFAPQADVDVFKNKLTRWTRDKIMSASNVSEFPQALHEAYRDIKETEAQNEANREAQKAGNPLV